MKRLFVFVLLVAVGGSLNLSVANAGDFDVAGKYAASCAICHNSGISGAPKKGDSKAWGQRLAKGKDALLASVKNGIGAMPAGGLCTDCSDEQYKALIQFISK